MGRLFNDNGQLDRIRPSNHSWPGTACRFFDSKQHKAKNLLSTLAVNAICPVFFIAVYLFQKVDMKAV
ncbi:hypothetical protein NC653_034265 [Populus alba x Populus x berolinensis]|uniref:Uncharacterized protein n=1 Tax=Populus alba x Populus x berolinensis TaxID=444605 RepID=A0AAD6LPZ6_9ROSI|nr:hypothetical protein NC653_034265 [Populus alba x Populus x berolinensis]